jgi:hypothetical protein
MPTINNLSTVTTVTSGDLVPIYSQSNGDARAASMSTILGYVQNNFASPEFETITAAPTLPGFTAALPDSTKSLWLVLSPSSTLASGTVVLPGVASCFDGQTVVVVSSAEITTIAVNGNGASVTGAPSSLGASGFFQLRFQALTSTWWCVAQSLGATNSFTNPVINGSLLSPDSEVMLAFAQEGVGTAVNYPALVYSTTGNEVGFAAFGADANIPFNISSKGSGDVNITAGSSGDVEINGSAILASGSTVEVTTTGIIDLTPGVAGVRVNGVIRQTSTTVSGLPSAAVVFSGARHFVTDSNATLAAGLGNIVVGGGSDRVPVYSDGTNWRIG